MNSVYFACATESDVDCGWIAALQAKLARQVEIAPTPEEADTVVIGFASPAETAGLPESENRNGIAVLTLERRQKLRNPFRFVIVPRHTDPSQLPSDLAPFRRFNVSTDDGEDALVCRLHHSPIRRTPPPTDALSGMVRLVLGLAATLFGTMDRTRAWLAANIHPDYVIYIHAVMVLCVLALLATGFFGVLRLVVELFRSSFRVESIEAQPRLRRATFWCSIAISVLLAGWFGWKFFPRSPRVPDMVDGVNRHLHQRLVESQMANGGLREHPTNGISQAWVSSQSLTGILATPGVESFEKSRVLAVLEYLSRARIARVTVTPDQQPALIVATKAVLPNLTASETRFTEYPSRGMLFNEFLETGGYKPGDRYQDLFPGKAHSLDAALDRFTAIQPTNEGWGYFEHFSWGVTEIAGWAAIAHVAALREGERIKLTPTEADEVRARLKEIIQLLRTHQSPDTGGFSAVSDRSRESYTRTYSTAMALWAMAEASSLQPSLFDPGEQIAVDASMRSAVIWLAEKVGPGGWKNAPLSPVHEAPFLGLAAQTLCAILRTPIQVSQPAITKIAPLKKALLGQVSLWETRPMEDNSRSHDSDRYLFPTDRVIESSTFLWYPWCVRLMAALSDDPSLSPDERAVAKDALEHLRARSEEFKTFANAQYNYVAAEGLIGLNWPMNVQNRLTADARP